MPNGPSSCLFVHLLGHLGVLLLEAVAKTLLSSHPLLNTAAKAAGLARRDSLGGEVVNAGVEAGLDKASESLGKKRISDGSARRSCQPRAWLRGHQGGKRKVLTYAHELLNLAFLDALLQGALLGGGQAREGVRVRSMMREWMPMNSRIHCDVVESDEEADGLWC
jgi:hypothetical protein